MAQASPPILIESAEDARQLAFLHDTAQSNDAAQARYAAAMYFCMAGKLNTAALEHYRIASKQGSARR